MKILTAIELCLLTIWMLLALLGLGEVIDLAYIKELLIGILTPILITTGLKAKKAKDFIKPKQAKELIF
nr:hypothetical protein [Thermoflexibacter sp.]